MIQSEPTVEQRPSPGATVDYPSTGSSSALGQILVAKAGAGQAAASAVQTLLRRRLRTAFLLLAACLGAPLLLALVGLVLRQGAAPPGFWQSFAVFTAITVVALTLGLLLRGRRPFSLARLRACELVMVASVAVLCAWKQSSYLYGAGLLAHVSGNVGVAILAGYHSLPWFALLAIYGLFVPNTWRRCTVMAVLIALCPFAVLAADLTHPDWPFHGYVLAVYLVNLGLSMAIGAAVAVVGSHHIEVLRREVSAARRLGQYQLKKRLGGGGMGEVYLAEHELLRRPCAIKLIHPQRASDPTHLLRFEREVQVTATLTHPNTVQVYDYGRADDGTFYYVMEYLDGLTLEELVERHGPLPPARAVFLLRQVCRALREAHAVGLIHRDIKPGNVIACARGGVCDVAKLLDFGLVRAPAGLTGAAGLTQEGTLAGTPAYMSPEQAAGKDRLDARSDVYSVGALAYFLLTGRAPFEGRTPVQVLAAHLYEAPAPLTGHRPDLPAELEAVVLRCLAKDPADRFPDARSLERALADCPLGAAWGEEEAAAWWQTQAGMDGTAGARRGQPEVCTARRADGPEQEQ
jgi:serine/threonine-protein kinase